MDEINPNKSLHSYENVEIIELTNSINKNKSTKKYLSINNKI